jgi:hypothetical protein
MVGMEFWVRVRSAIFADETIRLEWLAIRVTPNAQLGGDIVELRGRIRNEKGETAQKGAYLLRIGCRSDGGFFLSAGSVSHFPRLYSAAHACPAAMRKCRAMKSSASSRGNGALK